MVGWHREVRIELSIPAWFDWRELIAVNYPIAKAPFNPSLVRLALLVASLTMTVDSAFNPSLVRLALRLSTTLSMRVPAFNPSLVRLAPTYTNPATISQAFNPSLVRLALA